MERVKTTVAQIATGGGMCYAVQLCDGKFLLIDGGEAFEQGGERLYRYLKEKSQGETPVIAVWLFTHGHKDHIALATEFMRKYKTEIVIESILYNIPVGIDFDGYDAAHDDAVYEEKWFAEVKNYPNAICRELKTGDVFRFTGAKIDVLTTAAERYPDPQTNRNQTSAIFKITFDNGKSFMVLGDSEGDRLVQLLNPKSPIYCTDERLQSDILQVAHHGLHVCDEEQYATVTQLYQKISPKICFWPIKAERFYNDSWCQSTEYPYNRFLLDSVKEKNFHHSQTVVVDMEDLFVSLWID